MKKLLALVLAVLMVISMAACANTAAPAATEAPAQTPVETPAEKPADPPAASAEPQKMTLMMYTNTAIVDQIASLIVPFEEANNVDVDIILVSLEDYDTKLSTMVSSGESPDVMLVAEYQNVQYTAENMLLDLTDMVADPEYDWEDFAAGQRNHWTFDGKV